MATRYNLDEFTPPSIGFSLHPRSPDISQQLNNIYGMNMDYGHWQGFFANHASGSDPPFSKASVQANVVNLVRTYIVDEVIHPMATNTPGADATAIKATIATKINACHLNVGIRGENISVDGRTERELKKLLSKTYDVE